jgi:uncharacterized membrane protein
MNENLFKRWLLVSLVLNLFLAGVLAGAAWRWWAAERMQRAVAPTAPTSAAAQPRGLRYAADELLPEQRRAYRQSLRDVRRDSAALILSARESRQEVLRLLAAPQFDSAAMAAALARTREADAALRARVEGSVVDFAKTLPPEDRQKLANGLARRTPLAPAPATAASTTAPSTATKP